jgi:hypothetical protein
MFNPGKECEKKVRPITDFRLEALKALLIKWRTPRVPYMDNVEPTVRCTEMLDERTVLAVVLCAYKHGEFVYNVRMRRGGKSRHLLDTILLSYCRRRQNWHFFPTSEREQRESSTRSDHFLLRSTIVAFHPPSSQPRCPPNHPFASRQHGFRIEGFESRVSGFL